MNYLLLLISIWLIAGGLFALKYQVSQFKNTKIYKGTLIGLHKGKDEVGFIGYYDVVEYFDKNTKEFNQIRLEGGSFFTFSEFILKSIKTKISAANVKVRIAIKEGGKALYLSSLILELLLPLGLIVLGTIITLIYAGLIQLNTESIN